MHLWRNDYNRSVFCYLVNSKHLLSAKYYKKVKILSKLKTITNGYNENAYI